MHSNKSHVFVDGIKCAIVGRVTMDQIVIDVSEVPNSVAQDFFVEIIGENNSADNLAKNVETINYEITTSLTARVLRKEEK